ncbi:2-oxoglutarate dehydrogenase E1 component [Alteribacillus persepolensis]|uniref:2-oxoglutarate dehydrogenase E1 component n=1 Tax=Alteribacillus persepolensis TaxID=568899 RepID=A0A1G7Z8P9_9BACI|nr:2-oxoglutarate dehydrogenase E1 component [Alteribacillus persepolensis]SDH04977.1 2-oxoglutarate dehydrogenase E1 component [Alteribacillus persepolensis]
MSKNSAKHDEPWQEFYGPNLGYLMDLYEQYKEDPTALEPETKQWFDEHGAPQVEQAAPVNGTAPVSHEEPALNADAIKKIAAAVKLAENIRIHGHLSADVNPLQEPSGETSFLKIDEYGLTEDDLKQIPVSVICPDAPPSVSNGLEAINHLKEMYTKSIAFEFDHVHDVEEHQWLNRQVESGELYKALSEEKRKKILKSLTEVESFEQFLHKTFVGQKRFSIEGVDTLVPMLEEFAQDSIQDGARNVMIGMAHRGRLSVLAHVLGKPYDLIFSEFQHAPQKELVPSEGSIGINYGWTGDVKYHLGADKKVERESFDARITLANNPSHLEFVNPVVEGYARAAQDDRSQPGFPQQDTHKSVALLIHGDAAFPGEGIVTETLNMSRLKGYQTGGTLHIIANNQLGFTTDTHDSRSTTYASDPAKGYEIPIVHVNADDPESCMAAIHLAYQYRHRFNKDFLIDLIGYRRFGHNEMDEPVATQPYLYSIIKKHPTVRDLYAKSLVNDSLLSEEEAKAMKEDTNKFLSSQYDKVADKKSTEPEQVAIPEEVEQRLPDVDTGYDLNELKQINKELITWPEGFSVFPKLKKILERREDALEENGKVDWAHAETLAFATIVSDGTPVRLTGQDSQRGTFAHRHIVLHDHKNGDIYSPLHTLSKAKASFAVHNSPLSEGSIVGFEYGYNVHAPETLVLWEAQFGDFANAAQVIFDQFVSAGRAKWGQKSGMVLLLPHGYEGQGPEHSSARLERFLTLAAENNWNVANLTSSAQYFHLLRRQAATLGTEEVRPLVLMTPKSLLRNQNVASSPEIFEQGRFAPVIEEPKTGKEKEKVERIVFASGKMAVDLHEAIKEDSQVDNLHIIRVEELYPFPEQEIKEVVQACPHVKEFKWVQEEPENMGAWNYIQPLLRDIAPANVTTEYIGRRRRSSPSEGDPKVHKKEQSRIINEALTVNQ